MMPTCRVPERQVLARRGSSRWCNNFGSYPGYKRRALGTRWPAELDLLETGDVLPNYWWIARRRLNAGAARSRNARTVRGMYRVVGM